MKSKIFLILYFVACFFAIAFNTIGEREAMLWSKVVLLPAIVCYYLAVGNIKVNWLLGSIFLSCYIGEIYVLINPKDYITVSILSFLLAYLLLILYLLPEFLKVKWSNLNTLILIIATVISLLVLDYFILSLHFEKLESSLTFLALYSFFLSTLLLISVVHYFRRSTLTTLNLLIACLFFYFSDSFSLIDKFYLSSSVFNFVQIATQVFSYYFLVQFFILKELKGKVLHQNRFSLRGFTSTRI